MYAESEFSGARSHRHGGSEAEHVKALRKMGADIPESNTEIPPQLRYLYEIFMNMRFSKVPNGDGLSLMARQPLTTYDIDFYSRNSGVNFEMWEINCLLSLDSIFDRATT